jgi:hypothetical protein
VRLAEKTTVSAMLRLFTLVVRHEARVMSSPIGLPRSPAMEQPPQIKDTSWRAMLGKDEREATEEEIAALEAERGPFQPADGEG